MLLKAFHLVGLVAIFTFTLTSCGGGDEITDFVENEDIRIASITVDTGGTLVYRGNEVEEFDGGITGPYEVELVDADTAQVSLTAVYDRADTPTTLDLIEYSIPDADQPRVTPITSGENFTVDLVAGRINQIGVRVSSRANAGRIEYSIRIDRRNSDTSALLANVFVIGPTTSSNPAEFTPDFSPDVRSYDVAVDATFCNVVVAPQPEGSLAQLSVNGEVTPVDQPVAIPLEQGVSTPVVIDVTSADGSASAAYTLNLTRRELTAAQTESDNILKSLDITGGRVQLPFSCSTTSLAAALVQRVPRDVTSVTLNAVPSQSDATMVIGRVTATNPLVIADEGRETLAAGEPYSGALVSDLEFGSNFLAIIVTPPDSEQAARTYIFNIVRTSTNEVLVTTADELQQALRNAMPNDEIIIASGDYLGVTSAADSPTGSGDPEAHFYSAASGTLAASDDEENQFIILRAETADVSLMGDDLGANAVLKIDGDNWRIRGAVAASGQPLPMRIEGAQNGIVLDGSNNVIVENVLIDNIGERGVFITNGASNNQIRSSFIDNTGVSPLARDGITEVYGEAIVIGAGEGVATNNAARNMVFGRDIATEVIDIKAGTMSSVVQYSGFDLDNTNDSDITGRSVINVGASAEISYNFFDFNFIQGGLNSLAQLVRSEPGDAEVVEVYENLSELDGQSLPMVNGLGAGQTRAVSNFVGERSDGVASTYSGTVDLNFVLPSYQIQSTADASKCLGSRQVNVTPEPSNLPNIAVAVDCAAEPSQQWITQNDGDGFFTIALAGSPDMKLRSTAAGALWDSINLATRILHVRQDLVSDPDNPNADNLNAAFALRWRIIGHNGEVSFINRVGNAAIAENAVTLPGMFDVLPVNVVSPGTVLEDASVVFRQVRQ